jgi:hypothetical protein
MFILYQSRTQDANKGHIATDAVLMAVKSKSISGTVSLHLESFCWQAKQLGLRDARQFSELTSV